jgi:hypothetical protein
MSEVRLQPRTTVGSPTWYLSTVYNVTVSTPYPNFPREVTGVVPDLPK